MQYSSAFTDAVTDSHTQSAWAIGGGLEYGLRDGWSVRAEYLHIDLGQANYVPPAFGAVPFSPSADLQFDLVRAGPNCHF